METGKYAIFIWSAYGATFAGMTGLIAWVLLDGKAQRKALERLEAEGVQRRSRTATSTPRNDSDEPGAAR